MSQSATSGSPNTDNPSSGTPQEKTGSFWTQKIGGGAIGISVLLALIRIGPKLVENANRDAPHQQAVQAPDMAKFHAIIQGVARHHVEQQVDQAVAASTEALRTNPNDGNAYRTRAVSWMSKKNYEKALSDLDASIRVNPNDAEAHRLRAFVWMQKGDSPKAFADLDDAVRLKPTDAKALVDRAGLRRRRQEFDKAIADYVTAIRLDTTNVFAFNGLAWLYATCPDAKYRNGKKAVASAAMACKLTTMSNPHFIGTLAAAYAENGDFDNATKCQWLADNMYSDADKQTWQHLHRLYESGQPYRDVAKN